MDISVCMITKNESEKLKKALQSLAPYDVEVVVVDTGSTDDTKAVVESFGGVYGEFPWCDDFSKARNHSISLATRSWILVLDSDEWVEEFDSEKLQDFMTRHSMAVGRIERRNDIEEAGKKDVMTERISRFFQKEYYCYVGRIHEQVSPKTSSVVISEEYIDVPIRIGHSGYVGAARGEKARRNIALLHKDLEELGKDPYILYQLGKGYYMLKEYDEAAKYFEEALGFDLDPKLEYVQDCVETYGYTLLSLERFGEMLFLESIYEEFAVSSDYVFLMGLAYMNNEMFSEAVREFEKATTMKYCKVEGTNSFKAFYNAGVICECLGDSKKAKAYYQKCGNYELALAGLARI